VKESSKKYERMSTL